MTIARDFLLVVVLPLTALLALAGLIIGLVNGDWSWFR